ncbi:MAG TPA: ABC transporter permease [Actinomycetota bacterium]|nr:ABC transporter permease [Actinomycetota bacterium]
MIRRVVAQTRTEVTLTLRRGESLLVIAGIPVGILVFFTVVDVLPHGHRRAIDFLVPGVLALSVISSAMTSLGIATGFERQAGVLRRLGTTPLGRGGLFAAKAISVAFVVLLQMLAVAGMALGLGWRLPSSLAQTLAVVALGAVTFAGIGFLLAGRLKAEMNLALANGLFLVFLLLGGIVVPLSELPEGLRAFTSILPAEPLVSALRSSIQSSAIAVADVVTLAVWALVGGGLAIATFRWD